MTPTILFDNLLQHSAVDKNTLQSVLESLPNDATVDTFRKAIVSKKLMALSDVMKIHFESTLLPESNKLLAKLAHQRANRTFHKPTVHKQKFLITNEDTFENRIVLSDGELAVKIPDVDLDSLEFKHSDEKQAVMLAIDLAKMGEITESETILLETLDTFNDSLSAMYCLCWLYLCTDHPADIEAWSSKYLTSSDNAKALYEICALAYQTQNKHLLATALYQKLIRLNRVKSVWYLLLAYSQEKSLCVEEASENFQIYNSIGKSDELKEFALRHLTRLRTA